MSEFGNSAYAIVFGKNQSVLLVRHNYGPCRWSLPGGKIKRGELPQEAVCREFMEETGHQLAAAHLVGIFTQRKIDGFVFLFGGEAMGKLRDSFDDEIQDARYFSAAEFLNGLEGAVYPAQRALVMHYVHRRASRQKSILFDFLSEPFVENPFAFVPILIRSGSH